MITSKTYKNLQKLLIHNPEELKVYMCYFDAYQAGHLESQQKTILNVIREIESTDNWLFIIGPATSGGAAFNNITEFYRCIQMYDFRAFTLDKNPSNQIIFKEILPKKNIINTFSN